MSDLIRKMKTWYRVAVFSIWTCTSSHHMLENISGKGTKITTATKHKISLLESISVLNFQHDYNMLTLGRKTNVFLQKMNNNIVY